MKHLRLLSGVVNKLDVDLFALLLVLNRKLFLTFYSQMKNATYYYLTVARLQLEYYWVEITANFIYKKCVVSKNHENSLEGIVKLQTVI